VGKSGTSAERLREVTANGRSFPSFTSGATFTTFVNPIEIRPANRSGRIAVEPR